MTRFNLGILLTLSLSCLASTTATTVSVLELGSSGTIHSTTATSDLTSSNGILSFWKSLHSADSTGAPRKHAVSQYPGMSVVPDLFSKPTGGLVIGVFGGEGDYLDDMPTLSNLLKAEKSVGQFQLVGDHGRTLMRLSNAQAVASEDFASELVSKAASAVSTETGNRLDAISVRVEENDKKAIDASLKQMIDTISKTAQESGASVIVHIVVEDAQRRRLEDGNNGDNYEIPGYYDEDGVFHTRFRTIFEIQYFNIVLWTAVGLMTILFSANYMTMYMPLMPDTLLFGESAKMVAE